MKLNGNRKKEGKGKESFYDVGKRKPALGKRYQLLSGIVSMTLLFFSNTTVSMAANLGENASRYLTEQIFWAGVIVLAIVLCSMLFRRSWIQALIVGVVGGIILIFIKNPSRLESFGNAIINAMNLGI